MSAAITQYSRRPHSIESTVPGRLARLKDPQVWVCAIAAFTLIGLSTGMLDPVEPAMQAKAGNAVQASARTSAPVMTLASSKP